MKNGYEFSRNWFDWCFENPDKIKPAHTALYFFCIEHCNRLGWKDKFGLPTQMAMEAIGIKNWRTYSSTFEDLVDFGFISVIERSKNQWSATVIAIVKNTKAHTKALSKATQKHIQKQSSSIAVIDKPINQEPINQEQYNIVAPKVAIKNIDERKKEFELKIFTDDNINFFGDKMLVDFFDYWTEHGDKDKKMRFEKQTSYDISRRLKTWNKNNFNNSKNFNNATNRKVNYGAEDLKRDIAQQAAAILGGGD